MKRWPLAILLAPVLGGCMGGSAAPGSPRPPARCVVAWNGPANAAVRTAAAPPRAPYPWYAHRPIRPRGRFEAFVGLSAVIGAVSAASRAER